MSVRYPIWRNLALSGVFWKGKYFMYIIAGLGNPTREYEKTRHNVGFDTIDVLADRLNTSVDEKKFKGLYGRGDHRRGKGDPFKTPDFYEFKR